MKRFILSLSAAAVLSMPMAASALDKMDNNQLKSATGQAGVSIAVDDVVIYQKSIADTTYWDTDGMGDGYGAAGVMIDHAEKTEKLITIDAILDDSTYGIQELSDTFGTEDVGIVSKTDLEAARTDIDEFKDSDTFDEKLMGIVTNSDDFKTSHILDKDEIASYEEDIEKGNDPNATPEEVTAAEDAEEALTTFENLVKTAYVTNHGKQGFKASDDYADFDATNGNIDGFSTAISPLSIDVGTCEIITQGWEYNMGDADRADIGAVGGVVIGLPTVEINMYNTTNFKAVKLATGELQDDGTVDSSGDGDYMNAGHNEFLTIEKSGESTMAILGGTLEIAPH